jgi:hypothetical protein
VHDGIAPKVFRRLRFRHAQLALLERLTRSHEVHEELVACYNERAKGAISAPAAQPATNGAAAVENGSPEPGEKAAPEGAQGAAAGRPAAHDGTACRGPGEASLSPGLRAYHLAVTDLFVEKALAYLEDQAKTYRTLGLVAYCAAFLFFGFGGYMAVAGMVYASEDGSLTSYLPLVAKFVRAFTGYGMVVLAAVVLLRFGKAMLDQAERLMERRHALRQGRLFIHLNDGRLTIEQMEKAFTWNASQANAFGNMPTEAQAPWGAVAKELAHLAPEILRTAYETTLRQNAKGKEKDETSGGPSSGHG